MALIPLSCDILFVILFLPSVNFLLGGCCCECATENIICLWLCPAGLAKQDSFTFSGKLSR